MAVILCPTRGGQSSVANQQQAIALAKERAADLIFLYISDVTFLERLSSPVLIDVSHELDVMGEFLLAMAQERAKEAGIEADIVVRQGEFRQNLLEIVKDREADTVVIGRSAKGTGVTTDEFMTNLAEAVNEAGAEMLVVDDGVVVQRYRPPG
jgi:nucleotide-binding universal stress UspA family protein